METRNEASVRITCQKAISGTQAHCLRRLNSVDHDQFEGNGNGGQLEDVPNLIHVFEQSCMVRILGK